MSGRGESLEVRGSETLRFLTSRSGSSIIITIVTIFIVIIIPCRKPFLANDNSSDMQKLALTFELQDWCSPGKPSFSFNLFRFFKPRNDPEKWRLHGVQFPLRLKQCSCQSKLEPLCKRFRNI